MKNVFLIVLTLLLTVGCKETAVRKNVGEKNLIVTSLQVDSLEIDADSTSIRGNFVMMDSMLMFVDQLYCKVFPFSLKTGEAEKAWGGIGNGPNEMHGIMFGSTIAPADTSMWIVDSSNGVYEFSPRSGSLKFLSRLDFSWDKLRKDDYSSPSVYNLMEMSDFGISLFETADNKVLIPLSLVNRNLSENESDRYHEGRILGGVDRTTLKVDTLLGSMPDFYLENPMPFFEFFDYAVNPADSLIYVSHAPDSLIYCYRYPDQLLYTFGFEPNGVNRDYTVGYQVTPEDFGKDISHVGVNTGLWYDTVDNLLFRTSMTDFGSGKIILQAYRDNDLVAECEMPPYFKLLGRYGDRYYGVRFLPTETNDERVYFTLYSFGRLPL